ncbi:hypothetical protein ACFFX0_16975 [Citricoccus parietis]|uniref:Uncharacterized protein n=1 Tax=Citricoccus parietis TaxID=592307 RepID=A0ABV5G1J3_9MICC
MLASPGKPHTHADITAERHGRKALQEASWPEKPSSPSLET